MGMLRFSDDPPEEFVVPRLEDELIDELFYQEDEIGEMRHTAFMIECGLEEDPPDGPDVPPIPWKFDPSDNSTEYKTKLKDPSTPPTQPKRRVQSKPPTQPTRLPPTRTSSMDDLDDLEKELSPRAEPRRKLVAVKSGTLHGMRRSKKMPEKSHSADSLEDINVGLPLAKDENPSSRRPKRLVAAKSGSLHGMREAAKKSQEGKDDPPSPGRRRKLVATKSGQLHGMRRAGQDNPPSPASRRSKLVVTKSGTLHGMQNATRKKDGADKTGPKRNSLNRENARRKVTGSDKSTDESSDDADDFLSDYESSDGDSDVSIDTDDEEDKTKSRRPAKGRERPVRSSTTRPVRSTSMFTTSSTSTSDSIGARRAAFEKQNSDTKSKFGGALERARNGDARQVGSGAPTKMASVSNINIPKKFTNGGAIRAKGTKGMPYRAKSTNDMDIPPAFRASLGK